MAKVLDFVSKKEETDRIHSKDFKFGDEITLGTNEYWRGMVMDVKENTVIALRNGVIDGKVWFSFVMLTKEMINKTGRTLASRESFINWYNTEQTNRT